MKGKWDSSQWHYNMDVHLTSTMAHAAIFPGCGTTNKPDAHFCQVCGKTLLRCPGCGSVNLDAVMFCAKCGKAMPTVKETVDSETDSGDKPYIVYEGFPYAPLQRRSQTKGQAKLGLLIGVVGLAIFIPVLVYVVLQGGASDLGICLLLFFVLGAPLFLLFSWRIGRRGAEEEE